MSDEYTPTTEEVRERFYIRTFKPDMGSLRAEAFDRWLAERDAATRTAALEEAAEEWSEWEVFMASDGMPSIRKHGQTVSEWLRARAAKEETK